MHIPSEPAPSSLTHESNVNGKVIIKTNISKERNTPFGNVNENVLPFPNSLTTAKRQTEKTGLVFLYLSIMPLQLIKPNPNPLLFFNSSLSSGLPIFDASYTFSLTIVLTSCSDKPRPVSSMKILTPPSSVSSAPNLIRPPFSVYLRALSIRVFIIKKVRAASALTTNEVSSIFSVNPFASNKLRFLPIISNIGCKAKFSTFKFTVPCLIITKRETTSL